MARFGGNGLEVGEKNVEPVFGLLKHTRKREKRRGHRRRFAGLSTRPVHVYLCGSDDKYAKANQGK